MSIKSLALTTQSVKGLSKATTGDETPPQAWWQRNPAWPALTAPSSNEQKIVGLYYVPEGNSSNQSSLFAVTASGNYTVNFGDGTSANTASGTSTYKQYNFNNSNLYDATVTFTASGNLITRNSHGYINGDIVRFYRIVSTTGLTENKSYYVINSTTNTFQVSQIENGSAEPLTNNGSASLLPYKIATVTITPQSGHNLTDIKFNVKHSSKSTNTSVKPLIGWLELAISAPNATTMSLGWPYNYNAPLRFSMLEAIRIVNASSATNLESFCGSCVVLRQVKVDEGALASVSNMKWFCSNCHHLVDVSLPSSIGASTNVDMTQLFIGCGALTQVPSFDTSNATSVKEMFYGCHALVRAPYLDLSNATNASYMFSQAKALADVPDYDLSSCTDLSAMFRSCEGLVKAPNLKIPLATNLYQMFHSCARLEEVPLYDTSNVTNFEWVFWRCNNLRTVPEFDTSSATSMFYMFRDCRSLVSLPDFNTPNLTNADGMFAYCYSLKRAPMFNTSNLTFFSSVFSGCYSLEAIPDYDLSNCTHVSSLFQDCHSLSVIPALNLSSTQNLSYWVDNCFNLKRVKATGMKTSNNVDILNFSDNDLDANALNEIYTNLGTGYVSGSNIKVTGNPGVSGHNPSIATNKGWTVITT